MLMNFPCFQTDCKLVGGMSGGPVIDGLNGNMIGVVSSSFDIAEGEDHISYASLARTSLFLVLDAATGAGKTESKFLYDFVRGGAVMTDGELGAVSHREDGRKRTLSIEFNGVRMRNSLVT